MTARFELFPEDLTATAEFYVGVLGFALERDERSADAPYVALRRGDVRIGAAEREPVADQASRRPPTGVELVLEVDDLDAERTRVLAAGWRLEEDVVLRPWGLRDFRLLDPAGHYLRMTTRRSEKGPSEPEGSPASPS